MFKYYLKYILLKPFKRPFSYLLSFFYNTDYTDRSSLFSYNNYRIPSPNSTFCHAPSRSLYFASNGRVTTCCFNKEYTYGNYKDQSIRDLLDSKNRSLLIKNLANNNLSTGCANCQSLLDSESYKSIASHQYDMLPYKKDYPTMMEFELSNLCNFTCIMCSPIYSSKIDKIENPVEELNNIYDDKFLEDLKEYIPHLYKAKFFGGEPFLIDIYYKIWELIIELNPKCQIIVQTNASIYNSRISSMLSKGNFRLSLSIDSLNKTNYEFIRKGANFEAVMNNVEKYIEYSKKNKRPIYFSICPMKQNWMDIPQIIEYCNSKNIFINFNTVNSPYECAIVNMKLDAISEIIKNYKSQKFRSRTFIQRQNNLYFKGLINQIVQWHLVAEDINRGTQTYTMNEIKEILLHKARNIKDQVAINRFLEMLDRYPSEIELSNYHYGRLKDLKDFKVEKVVLEKREDVMRIKLNNLFMLN